MSFEPSIPSSSSRFQKKKSWAPKLQGVIGLLSTELNFSTIILIGAAIQTVLVLILPKRYAITPALFFLAINLVDAIIITKGWKKNPFLSLMIKGKTTAQVRSTDGTYAGPGQEKIAVLLLGAKSNHPLGAFAPDFPVMANYLNGMTKELEDPSTAEDTGFLGQTAFTRKDDNGTTQFLMVSYWRSIAHVQAYAQGPRHRGAWLWWEKTLKQHDHLGIMHEVFEAPKGMWETVYVNFEPVMLGATTYLKKDSGKLEGGNVNPEWVSSLIDANRGVMRTGTGRRGGKSVEADSEKFETNYYPEESLEV